MPGDTITQNGYGRAAQNIGQRLFIYISDSEPAVMIRAARNHFSGGKYREVMPQAKATFLSLAWPPARPVKQFTEIQINIIAQRYRAAMFSGLPAPRKSF